MGTATQEVSTNGSGQMPRSEDVTVREVDAREAKALLEANTRNRNLRPSRVDELVGAMKRGDWQFNGDAIRIAESGTLLDGQHRLAAVEKSGLPQRFVIVSGLPASAQETMDSGLKRGVSDVLSLRGEKDTARLGAAARAVFNYETYGTFKEGMIKPTTQQIVATVDRHPQLRDAVRWCDPVRKNTRLASAISTSCWYLFSRVDEEDARVFFSRLAQGTELTATDPIYALRRMFTTPRPVGNRIAPYVQGAMVVKAWNAWRAGDEMRMLTWRPGGAKAERFPKIDGLEMANA
jgi:hypothetical protein